MRRAFVALAGAYVALMPVATTAGAAPVLRVTEPPSSVALTDQGRVVVVGLDRFKGTGGGIAAYARDGAAFRLLGRVAVPGGVTSVATGSDGIVVLATRVGLAAIDGTALAAGAIRDVDVVRDDDAPRMNQVVRSRDGRYAFATESEAGSLAVASIGVASPLRPALSILAHVALDPDPDGLALSPDGNTIYVVSEVAGADAASIPGRHDRRLGRENCAINLGGNGVLTAIDVRAAISDPAHAVVARIAAGCAPSRVAVSPDGRVVWISVRGEARAIGFDAARLRNDSGNAVVADVAVGERPIGIAVSSDGTRVLVVNSTPGGDDDSVRKATISVIDTAAALRGAPAVVATVPTGAFAREIVREPDGDYLVTNYNAKAIDVVRLSGSSNR